MDMMEKLLGNLIDNFLEKTGLTRSQITDGVQQFLKFGKDASEALTIIQTQQAAILEDINERRRGEGKSPIGSYNGNSITRQ